MKKYQIKVDPRIQVAKQYPSHFSGWSPKFKVRSILSATLINVIFFHVAGRILTLLSISAGSLALTLAPFGLACTNLQKQGCVKRVIIWISAALMMLSGMFVGIAVSIFAKQTSDDYWEVKTVDNDTCLLITLESSIFKN